MRLSVVIPLFNESAVLSRLIAEVYQSLVALGEAFEVVCVDDGSSDDTLQQLLQLKGEKPELKVVALSRNFGLQPAIAAGLEYTKGEFVVVMDGDLQDPPELIKDLFQKIQETKGDVVSAVRSERGEKFSKRFYINVFHKIFRNISEEAQIEQAGNFCIMSRRAVSAILKFTEHNRYFPGIRNFIGFQHDTIVYDRPERADGIAKMNSRKLFSLAADAIYSFSKWPIKLCLYLGLLGVVVFLLAIIYALVSKFAGLAPFGWSSTFLAISFFGSVQLTFLGLIGEYVYRIYKEVQKRPVYLVKEVYE
ncbi:glycosyltransferase family 2 protein [Draconibacterium halophilum]|uniref:Glycosyltransferase family 2 protein n=1 Tax=Draconibacterium halophilum TaxID=2706887 RepID=A0A6C0RA72_9BACT|nr:glycosyltransferase family 2 protein [Draconibacterium halophilum]QIA06333.1 glycosyltransferase family 2 protein [Draconibacterium halophilum]